MGKTTRRNFVHAAAFAAAYQSARASGLGFPEVAHCLSEPGQDSHQIRPKVLPVFPNSFRFGAASSCVQIEGAAKEDGKGESIWDRFSMRPGAIRDGSNPSVACDSYHLWPQDVALLKEMGLQSYRMSISWCRILPAGKGSVNQKGIDHYSKVIDALREIEVKPLITCFHWDLPQALQDNGGWPNRDTAARFADYAALLARAYGDRVDSWCLLNELQAFAVAGYGWGAHAPGIQDRNLMLRATHTANLAQAAGFHAVKAERASSHIGIAHDMYPVHPASDSEADRLACERFDAFRNRWFLEPALAGKYPDAFVGGNPYEAMGFQPGDESLLRAPLDYTGVNYYAGLSFVAVGDGPKLLDGLNAHEVPERRIAFYEPGMKEVLVDLKERYKRPVVITETGYDEPEKLDLSVPVHDVGRIQYLYKVLSSLSAAIAEGVDVRGVHVWSLIDDWEWEDGFRAHIGLAQVDYSHPGKRVLKESGHWYGRVARSRQLTEPFG
jgi:beta-glucosidase